MVSMKHYIMTFHHFPTIVAEGVHKLEFMGARLIWCGQQ